MAVQTLSKSRIDKAGQFLAKGEPQTLEEIEHYDESENLFDDFRQKHLQPLTSTTVELQKWLKEAGTPYIIVQRLKRKPQILRKLRRFRVRLTQLQDIGGLRIIVDQNSDVDKLVDYIQRILKQLSTVSIKKIVNYREKGRDDSGYRATHVILEREGVVLELQIRSRIQHYWAELIERTSVIYGHHLKEMDGDIAVITYFKELSNLFYEIESGRRPTAYQKYELEKLRGEAELLITNADSKNVFSNYENEGIVKTLVDQEKRLGGGDFNNWIFVFNWNLGSFISWEIIGLDPQTAITRYVDFERRYPSDHGFEVVLVGSSSVASIRETHSHYFGLDQKENILETLNESIVGFSNKMDIDIGARQILAVMDRKRFWGAKMISQDTLKNHFCQDVLTFDTSLNTLIAKKLIYKGGDATRGIALNLKKKKKIESYL
jgi:ppGpp synthetase/RelA/SpoT-type nucleotidyltranferase